MTINEVTSPAAARSIAVIGMSGRFPGAKNLDEFWANLCQGVESSSLLSDETLLAGGVDPATLRDPRYVKTKPVLEDIEWFDAAFFGYPPREAELLDPQQRLFLECAWEALEDAGYDPERFPGWIAVYGGVGLNTYLLNNLYPSRGSLGDVGHLQWLTANDKDYLTTRVSYKLNLKGPSIAVQSACSTSLVAVHLACQSLLSYQCDLALAGGVSVTVPQHEGYLYEAGSTLSPDGHCRAFDARAAGTVFSSGVGIVALKRLPEALADGDSIRAVILGSAINNDGASRAGFTAPGVEGQAAVIAMAQAVADVEPESITYLEAHGTGTALGDPIEVAALTKAFRAGTSKSGFCALGSVKTNIGHLDVAAGVTGLIKTILALQHKQLPPSLNFERPNPRIDFDRSPFYINTQLRDWNPASFPRRAGVSSFGVGGSNAHVVLEEAPMLAPRQPSQEPQLLVLSAKTETALETATDKLVERLRHQPEIDLGDVAYTLQVGRRAFPHRRVLVGAEAAESVRALESRDSSRLITAVVAETQPAVIFMFPGQGAQALGMGAGLYQSEPTFRYWLDQCAELLRSDLGVDLREVLYPATKAEPSAAERLAQTAWAQPALFAVEYALAQLWQVWGIKPRAMIGHSLGEYVAACLAGVFTLKEGLALVAARGRLMQALPSGAMLSVRLSPSELETELKGELSLAAVNGEAHCVVSGPLEQIDTLQGRLAERGLTVKRLRTSHAFHSGMMEPMLGQFREAFKGTLLKPPQIPFVSNLSGGWITAAQATDPSYWARHLRQPVRFADGLKELLKEPEVVLLEVGPGQTLTGLARQHPNRGAGHSVIPSFGEPERVGPEPVALRKSLGRLWLSGVTVDWSGLHVPQRRRRVRLPTYPFERRRYWVEPNREAAPRPTALTRKPDLADWFYLPSWTRTLAPTLPVGGLGAHPGHWLVFLDQAGFGAKLIERLQAEGQLVSVVEIGSNFQQRAHSVYTLRPQSPEDYRALLNALVESNLTPSTVVHLWGMLGGPEVASPLEGVEDKLSKSFYSLLFLAQAFGAQPLSAPVQIAVISNGLQEVTGDEVFAPERATALGLSRVLSLEYPNLRCRSIDLTLTDSPQGWIDREVDHVLAELISASSDSVVAYRRGTRWVPAYPALRLEGNDRSASRLRSGGVYLITGGLGGLGLELAGYLAQAAQAKLVLVGRSTFPPRAEWEAWRSAHGEADSVSRKILKLQALEANGAEIEVAGADVTQLEQMGSVVKQTLKRFGTLNGVIHAAGVPGGGLAQLKTSGMAAKVLGPKVLGTRVLEAALKDQTLDFLILCSSTISILGGLGQVDYAAGNAFLDAFAQGTPGRRLRAVSINWDAWEEVGMAAHARTTAQRRLNSLNSVRALTHPLLNECVWMNSDQAVYRSWFSPTTHWVLSEHHILNKPALPGTACLEMARAAFEDLTQSPTAELGEVYFLIPLMIEAGETREVRTVLTREIETFTFRILSQVQTEAGSAWQEHARGKIKRLDPKLADRTNIDHFVANTEVKTITFPEDLAGKLGETKVYWGPRWNSLKTFQLGNDWGLATLELADLFLADLQSFSLHPALLDVATAFMSPFTGEGPYLPLAYQRLRVYAPLRRTLRSFVRLTPTEASNKETLSFDILILDEQGSWLVQIDGFTLKRVGNLGAGMNEATRREGDSGTPHLPLTPAMELDDVSLSPLQPGMTRRVEGLRPVEGIEAFARILAHPELQQVVVSTHDLGALSEWIKAAASAPQPDLGAIKSERPAHHPRPDLQKAYLAPRNETERLLAQVWQAVLGIEGIGVEDNFFELGGDSVMGIQIISAAQRAGLSLTIGQLFEHQTIAALVAAGVGQTESNPTVAVTPSPSSEAEQSRSAGYSTADFPEAGLSQEKLDSFVARIRKQSS